MSAPKGNRFWEARSSHGRNPIFPTPEALWAACLEYFGWVEENPLWECKIAQSKGEAQVMDLPKMRAMTINGLCIFLDIDQSTWEDYRKRDDYIRVCARAEAIIRDQKLTGAAADLLNHNIIARELGLRDKSAVEFPDENGKPQSIGGYGDTERAARLLYLLEQAEKRAKGG